MRISIALACLVAAATAAEWACAQQNMGEAFVYQDGQGHSMPYRLLSPPNSGQEGRKYPLILFLHGAGERGVDNSKQMALNIDGLRAATQTEEYASFLVAPQLPSGDTYWHPDLPYDFAMEILESVIQQYPVDTSRIYLTGLSLGGNGTFNYIAAYPTMFAGAVPLCGWGTAATAATIRDIPQWIFHGDADGVVPVTSSIEMFYAVDKAGGGSLYTEIRGEDHAIWSPIYADWQTNKHGVYPWLFSQQLPAEPTLQLVSSTATWKYLDDGSDPGPDWRLADFDDQSWKQGSGPFGYGEGDETTVVHCGPSAPTCKTDNFATTLFRHELQIDDLSRIDRPILELVRDDSAAIYVNGTQVFRDARLPADATLATYAGNGENSHIGIPLDGSVLREGTNVVAVELHQRSATDSDLTFDLRLTARQVPEPHSLLPCLLGWACLGRRRERHRSIETV